MSISKITQSRCPLEGISELSCIQLVTSFLPKKRLEHSKRVAQTATLLASKKDISEDKAIMAGVLHDIAKYLSPDKISEFGVICSVEETLLFSTHRPIWHALIAPKLLKSLFTTLPDDVLDAVQFHSTGKVNMAPLTELLFVSDYIEPGRKFNDISFIKALMEESFSKGVFALTISTIHSLQKRHLPIHYLTRNCYFWYKELLGKESVNIESTIQEFL